MSRLVLLLLIVCAAAPAGLAGETLRPHRLVRLFDFEERQLGNFEDMPMNWYAIGRDPLTSDAVFLRQPVHQLLTTQPGFPSFTEVGFDAQRAHSGQMSLRLKLNGGSAGAFLELGAVTAVASSDYLVTAMVQTAGLDLARARVAASFVDARGLRIDASRSLSEPIAGTAGWQPVSLALRGDYPDAAYILIEVLLLQPQPRPGDPLGGKQVILQDVQGQAWFDDIAVWQLPRVEVGTTSAVNLIVAPERPTVRATVRDLTARQLSASLTVFDLDGQVVDRHERVVGLGEPSEWGWKPDLPAFGWYMVELTVSELHGRDLQTVARSYSAFQWLPELKSLSSSDRHRFALDAQRAPEGVLSLLDEIMLATRLQRATVSVWDAQTRIGTLDDRQDVLDTLLDGVLRLDGQVVLSLDPLPDALAAELGVVPGEPLGAMQGEPARWQPLLAPVLLRQGQRVGRWQVGAAGRAQLFYESNLDRALDPVAQLLTKLVPGPQMLLPWSIEQSRRPVSGGSVDATGYVLDVPPAVTPDALGAYLQGWRTPPTEAWLLLESASADVSPQRHRVRDLALKMIRAWQEGASGLQIPAPWADAGRRDLALVPDPRLGVFANVAHQLAGRRVVGVLDVHPDLQCLILDGPAGGMLIAWSDSAPPGTTLDMWMGPAPVATDLWGNTTPVARVDDRHVLTLTADPQFITGINAQLALFRAGFGINPPFIESRQIPHARTLTLTNPWTRTISGQLQILGPEDWTIQPSRHYFSIAAGQSVNLPVNVIFPVSEVAGQKQLTARFEFDADVHYEVDIATPMELGLPGVEFDATATLEKTSDGTEDLVLVCIVTNKSDGPQTLLCFASLPGHQRQNRPVSRLEPGETAIRRFRFHDAAAALAQYPVRTGVREVNGPAILNRKIDVDQLR